MQTNCNQSGKRIPNERGEAAHFILFVILVKLDTEKTRCLQDNCAPLSPLVRTKVVKLLQMRVCADDIDHTKHTGAKDKDQANQIVKHQTHKTHKAIQNMKRITGKTQCVCVAFAAFFLMCGLTS